MSDEERPSLDSILTPAQPSEPAPVTEPTPAPEPKADSTGRLHGEGGKFAPKTPKAETPAVPVAQPPGTGVKPEAAPPAASSQPNPGHVPVQALIDQRLEARQHRQRAEELQRRLDDIEKAKTAQPVDWFADPDAAIKQYFAPIQQQFDQTKTTLTLRASKAEAIATHGKDTVAAMEAAVGAAMEAGDPEIQHLRQQMMQSDDPVGVAMQWHQRKSVLNEVGTDPAAYREKLKAEILAELNGGQPPANPVVPAAPVPVMPSNIAGARNVGTRAGPAWGGPKPLDDIFKRT